MSNRKWYEWLLTITYIVMILVCVYLNVFTSQKEGVANIAVNVVMFAIVGVIFLSCEIGSFMPLNDLIADLKKVTEKIRKDAMNSHQFLWEKYSEREKRELFTNETLKEQFQDYLYELSRIERICRSYSMILGFWREAWARWLFLSINVLLYCAIPLSTRALFIPDV